MKTLIYALACGSHGTNQLANALTSIGLEGGHELFGMGQNGDCVVGDNRAADAWHKFAPHRNALTREHEMIVHECVKALTDGLLVNLDVLEDGFFVDIGMHIADMWPIIEDVLRINASNPNSVRTRCIHIVRDGRSWVSNRLNSSTFGWYGSIQNSTTMYPYLDPDVREGKSYQEQNCLCWRDMHEYFLKAGKRLFKLEDFNKPLWARSILDELYPEAGNRQYDAFVKALYLEGGYRSVRHPDFDEEMFWRICGDTMRKVGYK